MSIFTSLLLGIVQGISEFLPISSSGHLSIIQNLFKLNYSEEGHLLFDVLLHVGTLISICVAYRRELREMILDSVHFLKNVRGSSEERAVNFTPSVRTVMMIIIATLPLIIVLPFKGMVESLYYKTGFIGFVLIVTGGLLYVSDRFIKPGKKTVKTMTVKDAILIGLAQAVALIPGLSRSGTTIAVGLTRGLSRNYVVRFSLLLSLPAVIGSTIISLISAFKAGIDWSLAPVYLVGMAVAAVVGYFSIRLLTVLMKKGKFGKFAYYCWGVGLLTIILSIIL
jgi:undecaprenyl-diphosphatase